MSLDDLPALSDALKFEKSQLYRIIREFIPHSEYCANTMMIPEKMAEWCSYLQCDGTSCNNEIVSLLMDKPKVITTIKNDCRLNTSVDPIMKYNTSCFDDYFCTPMWASKDYHYVLGIFGLILALMSLITTLIYIAAFTKEFGKKHTPALLLMCQSVCDIFFIIITIAGLISIYTSYFELVDQIKLYATIHVYIVLYIYPFACFFESLSIWIIIILIFDRYNYLNHGTHSKNLLTKKICFIFLIGISLVLITMSSLRTLKYNIVQLNPHSKYFKLVESKLGKDVTFNNLLLFWMKMPFESIFPLSIVAIIIIMVVHKLVYSGTTNNMKNSFICIQEHFLTKSILLISCLLLLAKVPKLVLHILKYEVGIEMNASITFELVCHLLDQIYLFTKSCIVYRYACPIFTNRLQTLICIDSGYNIEDYINIAPSENDEYKTEDYGLEKNCKKSILIDPSFDKETIV